MSGIPRVWANGLQSIPRDSKGRYVLSHTDIAQLDLNEQRAVDKSYHGGTIAGPLVVADHAGFSLDSSTASIICTGAGTITTSFGGRIVCADNDFPTFSTPRTRTVAISYSESLVGLGAAAGFLPIFPAGVFTPTDWYMDPGTTGMLPGNHNTGVANAGLLTPLTRLHDGSTNLTISSSFLVDSGRTSLPNRYPAIALFKHDPFLNQLTKLVDWTYFPNPGTLTAYKNGASGGKDGTANRIFISIAEAIDLSTYHYYLATLDEDYGTGGTNLNVPNSYLAITVTSTAADMRFQ